jgi:hypothetical protein
MPNNSVSDGQTTADSTLPVEKCCGYDSGFHMGSIHERTEAEIVANVSLNMLVVPRGFFLSDTRGLFICWRKKNPGGGISADVIWGEKYEKAKRKRGKM